MVDKIEMFLFSELFKAHLDIQIPEKNKRRELTEGIKKGSRSTSFSGTQVGEKSLETTLA